MTKADAMAELEKYRHFKGKSVVKKESSDRASYLIKEVAVLPFGQKITDFKLLGNPNHFSGHDWDVYAIIEPHTNFYVKIAVEDMEKKYVVK